MCLLSQLLSKVTVTCCSFTSNVQCVRFAAWRRTQAGDATDQWRDQWNAATVSHSLTKHLRASPVNALIFRLPGAKILATALLDDVDFLYPPSWLRIRNTPGTVKVGLGGVLTQSLTKAPAVYCTERNIWLNRSQHRDFSSYYALYKLRARQSNEY